MSRPWVSTDLRIVENENETYTGWFTILSDRSCGHQHKTERAAMACGYARSRAVAKAEGYRVR